MKIKDIMTREVVSVTEDTPIVLVAQILHQHGLHAVPVVDQGGKLVGMIAETDFFVKDAAAVYLPAYAELIQQKFGQSPKSDQNTQAIATLAQATARDIMTANPITLPDVAEIYDMITLVRMHHFKTFPVTDFTGALVGVVAVIDIIATIGKQMRLEEAPQKHNP